MRLGMDRDKRDDLELIRTFRESGDAELVGLLFQRYVSLIYGVCLKYLKNREESKDATMQLFEKLLVVLREHEITHFKSWLYVTTRNHCLMQLRAGQNKHFIEIPDEFMENEARLHLEDGADLESDLANLKKCMDRLEEGQKQCVQLFFLEQKCYKDICVLTRYEYNEVKSHIQNGKRNLKICMERNAGS
jgi:RNA polymerase sigma-70 factor, ECF subfamily